MDNLVIYVAKHLAPAASDKAEREVALQGVAPPMTGSYGDEFTRLALLLPSSMQPVAPFLVPRQLSHHMPVPFLARDSTTGLAVPPAVLEERRFRNEWAVAPAFTLAEVGIDFPTEDVEAAAWRTIALAVAHGIRTRNPWVRTAQHRRGRERREHIARVLARLSCHVEARDPSQVNAWVTSELALPSSLKARVRAQVGHERRLLNPGVVRWVLQEVAAAHATGRIPSAPRITPNAEHLLELMGLRPRYPVRVGQLLFALVLLNHSFRPGMPEESQSFEESALAVSVASAELAGLHEMPHDHLMRVLGWWVQPEERLPRQAVHARAELEQAFQDAHGMSVARWLLAAAVVTLSRSLSMSGAGDSGVRELPTIGRGTADRWLRSARGALGTDLRGLGRELRRELHQAGRVYDGWGSLPHGDLPPLRDTPLLSTGTGPAEPAGIRLLDAACADLPRRSLAKSKDGRQAGSAEGYLFEAHVENLALQLNRRRQHFVATERELAAIRGPSSGTDVLIGKGARFLAVEACRARLDPPHRQGDTKSLTERMRKLDKKAHTQPQATLAMIDEIVERLWDLRYVHWTGVLLVVQEAPRLNPAVAKHYRRLGATNVKAVCSIGEFEDLIGLGVYGFDVVDLVRGWQEQDPLERPLGAFLREQSGRFFDVTQLRQRVQREVGQAAA